jgi:hypothetical protein
LTKSGAAIFLTEWQIRYSRDLLSHVVCANVLHVHNLLVILKRPMGKGNSYQTRFDNITMAFLKSKIERARMVLYHRGAAIQASTVRYGHTFVARACILKEDGESTSLGDLGQFASPACAYEFAVRCASAFVDGMPMPRCPFGKSSHVDETVNN